jgi:glutathione S-transferase
VKLYYTATSPFVRKVLVVAHELGLADRIELVSLRPSPLRADATLSSANPLNKIPALVLDDGTTLYDSPVICEYLATLAASDAMLPPVGAARWSTLRTQALADGVLDAAILVFYERLNRPESAWWTEWQAGQSEKALQGLDAIERECDGFGDRVDVGTVSAAVAVGWLLFRRPFGDVLDTRPRLAAWYSAFASRASMLATVPKA